MFGALRRGFQNLASLILVVTVVGELQPKRTRAASRGFLAAARYSCYHYMFYRDIEYIRGAAGVVHYLNGGTAEDVGAVDVNGLRSLQAALHGMLVAMLGCLQENALLWVDAVAGLERLQRRR